MTEIWQYPFSCVPSEIQPTEPVLKTTEANMFLFNMEHHKCLPSLASEAAVHRQVNVRSEIRERKYESLTPSLIYV